VKIKATQSSGQEVECVQQDNLPQIEELLAKLARGKTFTKLDMSQVHMQIHIEEKLEK